MIFNKNVFCLTAVSIVLVQPACSSQIEQLEQQLIPFRDERAVLQWQFRHFMIKQSFYSEYLCRLNNTVAGGPNSFIRNEDYTDSINDTMKTAIADCALMQHEYGNWWNSHGFTYRAESDNSKKSQILLDNPVEFDVTPDKLLNGYERKHWNAFILYNLLNYYMYQVDIAENNVSMDDFIENIGKVAVKYVERVTEKMSFKSEQEKTVFSNTQSSLIKLAESDIKRYADALNLGNYLLALRKTVNAKGGGAFQALPHIDVMEDFKQTPKKNKQGEAIQSRYSGRFFQELSSIGIFYYKVCDDGSIKSLKCGYDTYNKLMGDRDKRLGQASREVDNQNLNFNNNRNFNDQNQNVPPYNNRNFNANQNQNFSNMSYSNPPWNFNNQNMLPNNNVSFNNNVNYNNRQRNFINQNSNLGLGNNNFYNQNNNFINNNQNKNISNVVCNSNQRQNLNNYNYNNKTSTSSNPFLRKVREDLNSRYLGLQLRASNTIHNLCHTMPSPYTDITTSKCYFNSTMQVLANNRAIRQRAEKFKELERQGLSSNLNLPLQIELLTSTVSDIILSTYTGEMDGAKVYNAVSFNIPEEAIYDLSHPVWREANKAKDTLTDDTPVRKYCEAIQKIQEASNIQDNIMMKNMQLPEEILHPVNRRLRDQHWLRDQGAGYAVKDCLNEIMPMLSEGLRFNGQQLVLVECDDQNMSQGEQKEYKIELLNGGVIQIPSTYTNRNLNDFLNDRYNSPENPNRRIITHLPNVLLFTSKGKLNDQCDTVNIEIEYPETFSLQCNGKKYTYQINGYVYCQTETGDHFMPCLRTKDGWYTIDDRNKNKSPRKLMDSYDPDFNEYVEQNNNWIKHKWKELASYEVIKIE